MADGSPGSIIAPAVTLTADEWEYAAAIGARRAARALAGQWGGSVVGETVFERYGKRIEAACAELAVALFLGVPWDAEIEGPRDVGPVQVRCTRYASGALILTPHDLRCHADAPFALATGVAPTFQVRGFLVGRDAAAFPSQEPKRPSDHWVPQPALRPMSGLIERLAQRPSGVWFFAEG
jgi:hypothetical protein